MQWNQVGKDICSFYNEKQGKRLKFEYRDQVGSKVGLSVGGTHEICFVIDATSSMGTDIVKARESVSKIASMAGFK